MPDCSDEELLLPSLYPSLEAKLGSAVFKVLTGEIGRIITQCVEEYAQRGIMMPGRLMLKKLYNEFKLDEERGSCLPEFQSI